MKFDTVIIGGGLAGLVCGITLSRQGQRCVIISSGQSALHFSSGSFDLLNALPDGTPVEHPVEAIPILEEMYPGHPYAKLGMERFAVLASQARQFLMDAGVAVAGDKVTNHYRVTPMGTLRPAWLTLKGLLESNRPDALPWKKIALFNVTGFLDFYPQFIADEFQKLGTWCEVHWINFPAFEHLRKNPTEMRSVNIARVFDQQATLDELVRLMKTECGDCEAIILPAAIGLTRPDALGYLHDELDKPVCLLPTLPPSVPGIRVQQHLCDCFRKAGGVYMLGDTVLKAEREGERVVRLYSVNHGDIPFSGKNIVLATGSYFSQGLIAGPERIYEPVFGLDVSFAGDREQWYDLNFFGNQAYQGFGIQTDPNFHGRCQGQVLTNLFVAGAGLGGFNALKEGCGAGVSMLSALYVAEQILKQ